MRKVIVLCCLFLIVIKVFLAVNFSFMKKYFSLIALLAALSILSGYLLSRMSFLARTAISLFKKKYYYYSFMKLWWKGALFNFGILVFLLVLQVWLQSKLNKQKAFLMNLSCLVLAMIGLYFTYQDFRSDLSHRLAGERLHLGFYLFWVGWMCISVFMIWQNTLRSATSVDKTGASNLYMRQCIVWLIHRSPILYCRFPECFVLESE